MADNEDNPSTHKPITPANPSFFIYDAPARIPIQDLLNPTMVTVTVRNEEEDPTGTETETFKIVRGVICARSGYFKKAFMGRFKEASEESITLNDVSPWVFKVFLTWLYTGLIYMDREDGGAQTALSKKRKHDEAMDASTSGPRKTPRTKGETDDQDSNTETQPIDEDSPRLINDHKCRCEKCIKNAQFEYAKSEAPEEADSSNPVTWPWMWLFQLYVFADQYDTKRLREQVMNFIQLRCDQKHPRMYPYPSTKNTAWCADRLATTSSLRRLLVDIWAKRMKLCIHKEPGVESQAREMELFPQSFIIECFLTTSCVVETIHCAVDNCTSPAHDHEASPSMYRCRFHEHGPGNQESNGCEVLWHLLGLEYMDDRD